MQAGRLRYRFTFQRPVRMRDASGEMIVDGWLDVFTMWGSVEALSGREYLTSSEFRAGITSGLRVRWRPDIDTSMRVICDGVTYDIAAVLPVKGLHKELVLMCNSGVVTQGGQP